MPSSVDEKTEAELVEFAHDAPQMADHLERRAKEKALVRKLDCFIAPVMMLLMLISYLDRGNIGFAATQGMTADIGLRGSQLNVRILSRLTSDDSLTTTDIDCYLRFLYLLYPGRIPHFAFSEEVAV